MRSDGKARQARGAIDTLPARGRQAALISFRRHETAVDGLIRRALDGELRYDPATMQLLCAANRFETGAEIADRIERGQSVVCDRYIGFGIAYGAAQRVDPDWQRRMQAGLPQPDATILLDIAPRLAAERKRESRDAFEADRNLLKRVAAGYRRRALAEGWIVIDGSADTESVRREVARAIDGLLARRVDARQRSRPPHTVPKMWGLIFCMAATTVGTAMIARWCADHAQTGAPALAGGPLRPRTVGLCGARPLMSQEER